MMSLLQIFLLLTCASITLPQGSRRLRNLCLGHATCGKCIETHRTCVWCSQPGFNAKNEQCDSIENLKKKGCSEAHIVNPLHTHKILKNETLRDPGKNHHAVQLTPQEITIHIRPKMPFKFRLTYRQAASYPLDLYYVLDLSKTMLKHKEKFVKLGNTLVKTMTEITPNIKLGFGSFQDKVAMPFTSMVPSRVKKPCDECAPPYGFRHSLSLTNNSELFTRIVKEAPITSNVDGPEGGFDAIMQALACKKEIGWRDQSRKILLFSTDAGFHFAGDGRLAGIVIPNDGKCHLDQQGDYTESTNQDYPSISQLASKIAETKVITIFAVTRNKVVEYEDLAKRIEGAQVGELASDSANIVDIIKSKYLKIASDVELKTEAADGLDVSFYSKCLGNTVKKTARCEGISITKSVSFEVSVEVQEECPKDRSRWNRTFYIYPMGLSEKVKVNLDIMCECDCELPHHEEPNSKHCNSSGTYECGSCTCNKGRYGKVCECGSTKIGQGDSEDYTAVCKRTNTSDPCEGMGNCVCGVCQCDPIRPEDPQRTYSGSFCECNDYSCNYHKGLICGGAQRGSCKCGQCLCNDNYKGVACECPTSNDTCRADGGKGKICNGQGECKCGKCVCSLESYYRGPTCEDCPTCPGRCEQNVECVQCMLSSEGEPSDNCRKNCTHVKLVDSVPEGSANVKACQHRDKKDNCMFYYSYEYSSRIIQLQRTKECPKPINMLALVAGVVAGVVIIGVFLLVACKVVTDIHDRREYEKFKKEMESAQWETSENPLYEGPTSTFVNPAFGGDKSHQSTKPLPS